MDLLKKVIIFIGHPTHTRTMGILIFFVLVAAVSLTVYVAQEQQTLRQRAAEYSQACVDVCMANSDVGFTNPGNLDACRLDCTLSPTSTPRPTPTPIPTLENSCNNTLPVCDPTFECPSSYSDPDGACTQACSQGFTMCIASNKTETKCCKAKAPATAPAQPPATSTTAPATSNACQGKISCSDCITNNRTCAWNVQGNTGTCKPVPEPFTANTVCSSNQHWFWSSCSASSDVCSSSSTETGTPTGGTGSAACPVLDTTANYTCAETNPGTGWVPIFAAGILSPPCNAKERCWRKPLPPTPIPPSSQCLPSDCTTLCAVGSSCQQVAGESSKKCTCQVTGSGGAPLPPTATPNPGAPDATAVLLSLSVKINGLPVPGVNPRTVTRPVSVIVQSTKGDVNKTGTIKLSTSDGLFKTDSVIPINLSKDVPTNTPVNLVIKSDFFTGFLPAVTLQPGLNSLPSPALPALTLKVGIGDDGNIDAVSYYNKLTECYGNKTCSNKKSADINDDGKVDGIDFNIFVRSLAVLEGILESNSPTTPLPTPTASPTPTPKP